MIFQTGECTFFNKFTLAAERFKWKKILPGRKKSEMLHTKSSGLGAKGLGEKKAYD